MPGPGVVTTAPHVAKVLEVMDPKTCRQAGQVLIASMVDAPQLEEALERIYAHEDTEAGNNALRAMSRSGVSSHLWPARPRARQDAAHCVYLVALLHLDPNDDPHDHRGGLKLLCDCSRMWIVRLTSSVRPRAGGGGWREGSRALNPLLEDTRYASKEERRRARGRG